MPSGEATHTNFIVFDLTRPWFEPTIYRTRGEQAIHYTNDAVIVFYIIHLSPKYIEQYSLLAKTIFY